MFVKICGITSEQDALLAAGLGADAVGFLFSPSPRRIDARTADFIGRALPPEVIRVGVFRNEHRDHVVRTVHRARLQAVQLHGSEPLSDIAFIVERVSVVIHAMAYDDSRLDHLDDDPSQIVLIDGPTPGSGQSYDWTAVKRPPPDVRFMVAGGLTPDNVAQAINVLAPWGVDVSSGVESTPGLKDPRKVRRFIRAAKDAGRDIDRTAPIRAELPYDWDRHD
ncbi:MAG: phosphoribosylanthranilate isomerase [Acidimicrobiia bacterium]|nr:phosphoribosylanthranilate isomerase [Acidimicrobiia bacterium]MBP8179648.1 phosphoribosylanthranilate isomerase [Acidimicrobiia bacterium]